MIPVIYKLIDFGLEVVDNHLDAPPEPALKAVGVYADAHGKNTLYLDYAGKINRATKRRVRQTPGVHKARRIGRNRMQVDYYPDFRAEEIAGWLARRELIAKGEDDGRD